MTAEAGPVNTKKSLRREVSYASLDAVLVDARRLVAAEGAGTLRPTGNWTLGQALGHVATWMDYAFDGYPARPPWFIRLLAPMLKKRVLYGPAIPGIRMPGVKAGTYAVDVYSTAEGLTRLERAVQRLEAQAPTTPSPLFGMMTHEEWKQQHRRHAELHLSFFWIA
jgi:hypothetical protein